MPEFLACLEEYGQCHPWCEGDSVPWALLGWSMMSVEELHRVVEELDPIENALVHLCGSAGVGCKVLPQGTVILWILVNDTKPRPPALTGLRSGGILRVAHL